jgi:hypothetical protein
MTAACLNCGQTPSGEFCQCCGQRTGLPTFTMASLLAQVPRLLFDVDRGAWHTLKGLVLRPGLTINAYLDGRRISYTNPFTLLLLLAGVNSVLYTSGAVDFSQITAQVAPVAGPYNRAVRLLFEYSAVVQLLQVPVHSVATRMLFRRWPRIYAEHIVMNAYLAAVASVGLTVLFPLLAAIDGTRYFAMAWYCNVLLVYGYCLFALYRVFAGNNNRMRTILRSVGALVLEMGLTWLLFALPMMVYVYWAS